MNRWLTYDQVSLIPTQVSTLEHRGEADTSVQFGPVKLGLPLIAAPMPDVSNGEMAMKLADLGSFGWVHRFQSTHEQEQEYRSATRNKKDRVLSVGVAIPANYNEAYLAVENLDAYGMCVVCIDTANGANAMIERTIKFLKDKFPEIFIVAGNVASAETFLKLEEWGADAIRVGIAGGSVCETRTETGVYSPMASVIKDVEESYRWHDQGYIGNLWIPEQQPRKALLIADGGIKTPADMCKALALGADLVMVGGVFAGTKESPGEVLKMDGKLFKVLRGAASYSVQRGNSGYVEGAETLVPYQGSVEKVINRFAAGLRSSMSYMNAKTLTEYRKNVQVIEVG